MPLVGVGTLTDENILKGMGDEAIGVITSLHYSAALDTPANKKFSAAYEKRFGRSTSLYSAQGYTGARFYYEALKAINGEAENKEKFVAALRQVAISDDPRGPMKMDEAEQSHPERLRPQGGSEWAASSRTPSSTPIRTSRSSGPTSRTSTSRPRPTTATAQKFCEWREEP
jgi:hypothetical protein